MRLADSRHAIARMLPGPGWLRSIAIPAFVLTVLAWPRDGADALAPHVGLDSSWHAAFAMAAHRHLRFGTHIIFTYGPLGFLNDRRLWFPGTAALAFGFRIGLAAATFAVILSATRRALPIAIAFVVAYVAGYALVAMWSGDEAAVGVAFALCVACISREVSPASDGRESDGRWRWIAIGVMAGIFALEKLSIGLAIVALAVIALGAARGVGRRHVALTAIPAALVFAGGWFATGNRPANLIAYLRSSKQVSVGYSAMATNPPPSHQHDVVFAAIAMVAIAVTAFFLARRVRSPGAHLAPASEQEAEDAVPEDAPPEDAAPEDAPPEEDATLEPSRRTRLPGRATVGIAVATSLTTWILFKEAFVRQDGHRLVFFASVPLILSALYAAPARDQLRAARALRRSSAMPGRVIIITALLASSLLALEVARAAPTTLAHPLSSVHDFVDNGLTLALPARRHRIEAKARAQLVGKYDLSPDIIARTSGQTVDIDPSEEAVAWAYPTMRWDPIPTLQAYTAYTPALDHLDAGYVLSARAPRFILRELPRSVDHRLPIFDGPATQLAIECNYHEVSVTATWELVERNPNRCGAAKRLGQIRLRFGARAVVPVAATGTMIVATFDLHQSLWWRVLEAAYKAPEVLISVNDAKQPARFVVGTAGDPHLLRPSDALGYARRFSPEPISSFAFVSTHGRPPAAEVTVTYYSMPMARSVG